MQALVRSLKDQHWELIWEEYCKVEGRNAAFWLFIEKGLCARSLEVSPLALGKLPVVEIQKQFQLSAACQCCFLFWSLWKTGGWKRIFPAPSGIKHGSLHPKLHVDHHKRKHNSAATSFFFTRTNACQHSSWFLTQSASTMFKISHSSCNTGYQSIDQNSTFIILNLIHRHTDQRQEYGKSIVLSWPYQAKPTSAAWSYDRPSHNNSHLHAACNAVELLKLEQKVTAWEEKGPEKKVQKLRRSMGYSTSACVILCHEKKSVKPARPPALLTKSK